MTPVAVLSQWSRVNHFALGIGDGRQLQRANLALPTGHGRLGKLLDGFLLLHPPAPAKVEVHQHLHVLELPTAVGRCPAVLTNSLEPGWHGVLQKATYELAATDLTRDAAFCAAGRVVISDAV